VADPILGFMQPSFTPGHDGPVVTCEGKTCSIEGDADSYRWAVIKHIAGHIAGRAVDRTIDHYSTFPFGKAPRRHRSQVAMRDADA